MLEKTEMSKEKPVAKKEAKEWSCGKLWKQLHPDPFEGLLVIHIFFLYRMFYFVLRTF
jgi:hypothetical protein